MTEQLENYLLVEKAIKYIEENYKYQPSLEEIADSVNISKYHFQRIFSQWAGISPNKFLQYITISHAKGILDETRNMLEVSHQLGLSSTSRLHDLFISFEAITPGEYKKSGEGLEIAYGFHYTQFGQCFIGVTSRGICSLEFVDEDNKYKILEAVKEQWYRSSFIKDDEATGKLVRGIFDGSNLNTADKSYKLLLKGTNFQIKVWEALINIDFGRLASYKDIAAMIDKPKASRAVGNAIANNPIAYLIPCHRVIRDVGVINNYRWGNTRKKIIIGWESSKAVLDKI